MNFADIGSIALISLLASMSPGPDFAMVVKNSLSGNFRSGFLTALGVASALLIHVSYCLFGIALLIQESPSLFQALKYGGAAYLFYLGISLLREQITQGPISGTPSREDKTNPFLSGFLCNVLNPKATLFVLSLFTQVIDPGMALYEKILLVSILPLVVLAWFTLLAFLITHQMLQSHFTKFQLIITRVMGASLCALAVYVALFG